MTSQEIRSSFLKFFESKNHRIVPSAPVIPHGDPTLLFTNAGMNQFKDIFLGLAKRDYTRAADTQKCIRVSGKHNDLEEVGRDTYHHTFFEMLGNWSFGDYYKKEAIGWAWELLTGVWKLPKARLWATVYRTDDESFELWKRVTDINPSHILRFDEKDNFWEMGDTGPCGPCSEIHFDLTPEGNAPANLVNAGSPQLIEIWNLVFIQNNRKESGELEELPAKHVDTGMGFERVCAVMESMKNNFRKPPSNYDTDIFMPIINKISELTSNTYGMNPEIDVAHRVIADHIRALTFAIGDGAIPSNDGRGYVLRRILRRAARYGRNLGMREPFLYKLVDILVQTMSDVFPEIKEHQQHIERVIKGEENGFNQTLGRGLEIFDRVLHDLGDSKVFPGDVAFRLYDTYGFPLDLTQLMCSERGLEVDDATFNTLMNEQKGRSRESSKSASFPGSGKFNIKKTDVPGSEFLGYTILESPAEFLMYDDGYAILDKTPFYGEAGGQVGDTGTLIIDNKAIRVLDTQRDGAIIGHRLEIVKNVTPGSPVLARVDIGRRLSIMRNHSATHLLDAALRKILGTHVHQSGSFVNSEYLRFDFAHFSKVSDDELRAIEELINQKISESIPLHHHRDIAFEEARKMGALMFFGDKYGDRVNVVQFGDFSMEFCGGTHVANTSEIGYFKFRSEGSVASGTRRVEALTAENATEYLALQNKTYFERVEYAYLIIEDIQTIEKQLASAGNAIKSDHEKFIRELNKLETVVEIPSNIIAIDMHLAFDQQRFQFKKLEDFIFLVTEEKKRLEKELSRVRLKSTAANVDSLVSQAIMIDEIKVVAAKVDAIDNDSMKSLGDTLRTKIGSGVGLLASVIDGKVSLVCIVTDDLVAAKKLSADKIVGEIAKLMGGGGGGRPNMATAGAKDVSKLEEALQKVSSVVKSMLK